MMKRLAATFLLALGLAGQIAAQAPPPIPALPDTQRLTQYVISGTTCACAVNFAIYGDSTDVDEWIQVWISGVQYLSTDATHGWALSSATGSLGSIPRPITDAVLTFNAVQTGTVQILGARRPRRVSQFAENRGVPARDLNQAVTDLVAQNREQWDLVNRAILGQPGEVLTALPAAASRQNLLLGFGATGQPALYSLSPTGPCSLFTSLVSGCVPASGGGTANFLRADGVFAAPGGSVGSGTAGQLAVYPSSGTSVSGSNSVAGDAYFGSGRPECDPRSQGAKGDGSTDDTGAFNACLTNLAAIGGGTLYVSSGTYCLFSGITATGPVYIKGSVVSYLSACGHNVTVLTLSNANSLVDGIVVLGDNSTSATGDGIHLTSGCVRCTIQNTIVNYGRYGILIDAADHVLNNVQVQATYGTAAVRVNAGGFHYRTKIDNSWPGATPSQGTASPSARANTTGYSSGAIVTQSGFLLEATASGTSAGSFPGLQPYGTTITDGTVTWKIVMPSTYYGLQIDGGTTSFLTSFGDFSGPYTAGIAVVNTNAGAGPEAIVLDGANTGGNLSEGILVSAGNDVRIVNSPNISSCIIASCIGINYSGSWSGDSVVQANTFFNLPTAINYSTGTGLQVVNNGIFGGVANAVGVSVAAAQSNFVIAGNRFNSAIWGALTTGVNIASGSSNHYRVANNVCTGTSTCVSDSGSGLDKQVEQNGVMTGAYTWSATTVNTLIFAGGGYDLQHSGTTSLDLWQNSTFAGSGVQIGQLTTGHGWFMNIDNQPIDIGTNNTIRATFLGNGNLGLGTERSPQFGVVYSQNVTTGVSGPQAAGFMIINQDSGTSYGYNALTFAANGLNAFFRGDGTAASPSNLGSGETIGVLAFGGFGNSLWQSGRARIAANTLEAWSGTTFGTSLEFDATPAGGSRAQSLLVEGGVIIGTGTTDPGANTAALTGQTFASLKGSPVAGTIAYITDGKSTNCGDSACTTWGTTVTGGTGALKLFIWYDGANWTLAGK